MGGGGRALLGSGKGLAEQRQLPGGLGAIAARLDEQERARRIAAELEHPARPDPFADHIPWRARIAALLGDRSAAVSLLRDALTLGYPFWLTLHNHPDFEPLRQYKPFLELTRSRE